MKISVPTTRAMHRHREVRGYRYTALVLAALLSVGCSTQPMTLNQELTAGAVAGAVGAGSGAIFAAAANKSYPVSILIGAGGMAGFVLLYEEIKREAAEQSNTPPVPNPPGATSAPAQNP
jgi:hypothetical protein